MSELLPISDLTAADIWAEIQFVTLGDLDPDHLALDADHLATFLAQVDWSGDDPSDEVAELLGKVEGLASEYADGDLTDREYRSALLALVVPATDANADFHRLQLRTVTLNGSRPPAEFVDKQRRMVTA